MTDELKYEEIMKNYEEMMRSKDNFLSLEKPFIDRIDAEINSLKEKLAKFEEMKNWYLNLYNIVKDKMGDIKEKMKPLDPDIAEEVNKNFDELLMTNQVYLGEGKGWIIQTEENKDYIRWLLELNKELK